MKKKIISVIFTIIFTMSLIIPKYVLAEDVLIEQTKDIFDNITAPNLLLAETKTGKIIYERKAYEKIFPASITKLMTAVLVVENCELDDVVTVSEKAVTSVPSGYVNANLQVGEELTVEDLLYVMLIPSANDAANALAEHVGGNIESFSTMMNSRAKELGCTDSNFTNPSGLHEENHYTTTRDLFIISQKAISNNIIKKILGTKSYALPSTNKYIGEKRIFTTTNYMIKENLTKFYCDYCIGAKTGYTGEAKNCVVEFASNNGIDLTAIVMGEDSNIKGTKFLDAKKMFEYVFENYEKEEVTKKNEKYENIKVANGSKDTKELNVLYKDSIDILKIKSDNREMEKKVEYTNLKAPLQKGDVVGKVSYMFDGINYETELIAEDNVDESKTFSNALKLLVVVFIIYIIYKLKKSNKKYGNHGKKYKGKNLKAKKINRKR